MIIIAKDFTTAPGPRYKSEGDYSGELFREEFLVPKVRSAIQNATKLVVDLDGTSGYGTSFLEESFGGLIRMDGISLSDIQKFLEIRSAEEPSLIDEIEDYLADAHKEDSIK